MNTPNDNVILKHDLIPLNHPFVKKMINKRNKFVNDEPKMMKMLSINLHSLKEEKINEFSEVHRSMRKHAPDVVIFQDHWEIHIGQKLKLKNYMLTAFDKGYKKFTKQTCAGVLAIVLTVKCNEWQEIKHISTNFNLIINDKCNLLLIKAYISIYIECYIKEI